MAMILHPEIQRKAQEEIDRVVGQNRLPEFADRNSLPLIDCILKETLRWGTPVPLSKLNFADVGGHSEPDIQLKAPPHRLTKADNYQEMFLPEGSLVSSNLSVDSVILPIIAAYSSTLISGACFRLCCLHKATLTASKVYVAR